ncbi:MAG: DUF1553 domain-containing protein [Planctomycetes bacterium]|nr:DUF1553 domain-containing protein [Planctomycetota bacterium]
MAYRCILAGLILPWTLTLSMCVFSSARAEDALTFNRDIRPILADKCFACHGFDEKKRESGLRLDTQEGATSPRDGVTAIVPGNLNESAAWQRILSQDPDLKMPPPESHKELDPSEIERIKKWIEQGAAYQKHWAFEPIAHANVPAMPSGGRNPIDAFLAERLGRESLSMAPEADKSVLIRRVAFALTGLPPTLQELETYLGDDSADAYEKMVDRYLKSIHYGEEMARHWLDIARYADTHGLHLDNERQMWAYRDWVVNSFNRNQTFDQFTIEQLAGDLLPNPSQDQLTATGFNRCNVTTSEGGSIDDEYYYRYAVDRTSTMAATWMGLTAGCAVCHDHKFDPISAKEFYSMYAFFNASADPAMDGNALLTQPVMKLEKSDDGQKLAEMDQRISQAVAELEQAVQKLTYNDPAKAEPRIEPMTLETVWMDDAFPPDGNLFASPGQPTMFVSSDANNPVFSGSKSLKRTDPGLAQDVWDQAKTPLAIPQQGKIFAQVYLDPSNMPQSIMIQFFKNGWLHRAMWGNYDAIPWGAANTTQRVNMGALPEAGKWVRLEFPVEQVGLAGGDAITGFALTQFGGTVYWDRVGVAGVIDPASDPQRSFLAWWRAAQGKDTPGLDGELNAIAKGGPKDDLEESKRTRLLHHYITRICVDTKPSVQTQIANVDAARSARQAYYDAIPSTFIYRDNPKPRPSFVMLRGQYNQPGEPVQPGVPAVLPALRPRGDGAAATRLELAQWLVAPDHPLTARVAVNRFWQQMFGVGLVKTSGDFGTQGEPPSHPELLDWLSTSFIHSGWDVKQLMRTIVTSAAFRQSSRLTKELIDRDPENRLHARGPRLRLDAEQIRDNALFVGGLIDLRQGGKGVKPYQPNNIWEPVGFVGSNTRAYQRDQGAALYRRSLYTFFKRTAPPPFMVNFDAPNREQSCTRRERSNTPLQALQLLNDIQHVEAARALGQRMLTENSNDVPASVRFLFRTVLSRDPSLEESAILVQQYAEHRTRYEQDVESAKRLISQGETKPNDQLAPAELAAATLVASTVLNMDETLSRN